MKYCFRKSISLEFGSDARISKVILSSSVPLRWSCVDIFVFESYSDITQTLSIPPCTWSKCIGDKPPDIQEFSVSLGEGIKVTG